jgi:hypothetical protein
MITQEVVLISQTECEHRALGLELHVNCLHFHRDVVCILKFSVGIGIKPRKSEVSFEIAILLEVHHNFYF